MKNTFDLQTRSPRRTENLAETRRLLVLVCLLVSFQSMFAQRHVPPPRPNVAPLIGERYANDGDGDRIDDQLLGRAKQAAAAERAAVTAEEKSQAQTKIGELVNVELIFKEPVTQRQIDTFTALGGEITYIYRAVSYGWNARIPLHKVSAVPAAMGATLVLVSQPSSGQAQLNIATRTGRVRPVWMTGFGGNVVGFSGDTNTTIAILDSGVDESHTDLNGRRVFWQDYTATAYANPTDINGHGSHVAGIALGSGASSGNGIGTLKSTVFHNMASLLNNQILWDPVELPANTVGITATAVWNGGGGSGTRLRWWHRLRTDPINAWAGVTSIVGASPLTLSLNWTGVPERVYMPALIQSNGITDFVITTQITNHPGMGDGFNKLRGVSPGCNWAGAKVTSDAGGFTSDNLGAGIDDLVANRVAHNIKIMNISLGGSLSPVLRQKVNTAANHGVLMVVAAGNRGANFAGIGAAQVTEVGRAAMALTVAAANSLNQLTEYSREGFSTPDSTSGQEEDYKPDLMAPGGSYYQAYINSVDSNNGDGTAFADQQANDYKPDYGTSMATPFAAGCAALVIEALERSGLIWDFNSSQHSRLVKMILCATASESNANREGNLNNPIPQRALSITNGAEILPPGKDLYEGYGMLNADAAVEAVSLTYANGAVATVALGPTVTDRRAWARAAGLLAGRNFSVTLMNPASGDFDLYLYSATPSAYGTPVLLASSTQTGNGVSETLNYTASADQSAFLVVKRVSGSGAFNLIGNLAPSADFVADVTNGLVPLTVNFTNLTTGDATNFLWNFGDGNTSTAKDSSNTYLTAGTYTVMLIAVGPGGTNSVTKAGLIGVTNQPPPVVSFTATPTEGEWPLYVSFNNTTTGATSNFWEFGDGDTSTVKDAGHTYVGAGNYSVTLIAIGPGGTNSVTQVNYITVTDPPAPVVDFTATPTIGLAPLDVSFVGLTTGGTNYNYDFGDGNSAPFKNTSHTYTNSGTYSVTFSVIGPGGTNSLSKPGLIVVTNEPLPVVDFIGVPTTGLAPLTVFFTNLTSGATNFTWDFGGGQSSTNKDPSNTYTNAGSFTVTLTATGPGGTKSAVYSQYILVTNVPPAADFVAAPTKGFVPLTVYFTNLSSGATGYTWQFGDGNTSTNDYPANTYTTVGSYAVTLAATGAGGTNTVTRMAYILVSDPPLILPPVLSGGDFTFSFETISEMTYAVEFKDSLDDPGWQLLRTLSGDGTLQVITNSATLSGQRFFRVRSP